MNGSNRTKLNYLLKAWPHGTVAVASWLKREGISYQLVDQYCKSGWLEPVGRGAYKKEGDSVTWAGGLYAIQFQLNRTIHVGGKTALNLRGFGHFVAMGFETVWFFGNLQEKLPAWFKKYDWNAKMKFVTTGLFGPDSILGIEEKKEGAFSIKVSSPERAVMEMLYLVPKSQSFEESSLIMEGLTSLRPDLVSQLLQQCQSIKVKRLFMVLAEKFDYPWVEKLDLKDVDFGKGKRMVTSGGKFNTKYNITVPMEQVEDY